MREQTKLHKFIEVVEEMKKFSQQTDVSYDNLGIELINSFSIDPIISYRMEKINGPPFRYFVENGEHRIAGNSKNIDAALNKIEGGCDLSDVIENISYPLSLERRDKKESFEEDISENKRKIKELNQKEKGLFHRLFSLDNKNEKGTLSRRNIRFKELSSELEKRENKIFPIDYVEYAAKLLFERKGLEISEYGLRTAPYIEGGVPLVEELNLKISPKEISKQDLTNLLGLDESLKLHGIKISR